MSLILILIFLLCSLLQLFVTNVENFPSIIRMLRCAMASADRLCGLVANGLVVGGVAVSVDVKIKLYTYNTIHDL